MASGIKSWGGMLGFLAVATAMCGYCKPASIHAVRDKSERVPATNKGATKNPEMENDRFAGTSSPGLSGTSSLGLSWKRAIKQLLLLFWCCNRVEMLHEIRVCCIEYMAGLTLCMHMCVCVYIGSGQESVHIVFTRRAAAVKARPLWLWPASSCLSAEICWSQETYQPQHAGWGGFTFTFFVVLQQTRVWMDSVTSVVVVFVSTFNFVPV